MSRTFKPPAHLTETEWLALSDPVRMPRHFRGRVPQRKCALLACAYVLRSPVAAPGSLVRQVAAALQRVALRLTALQDPVHEFRTALTLQFPNERRGTGSRLHLQGPPEEAYLLLQFVGALIGPGGPTRRTVNQVAMALLRLSRENPQDFAPQIDALRAEHTHLLRDLIRPFGTSPRTGWRGVLDRLFSPDQPPGSLPVTQLNVYGFKTAVLALLPESERGAFTHLEWSDRVPLEVVDRLTALAVESRVTATTVAMVDSVREVLGSPFRAPPAVFPGWLECNHGAARHIAETIAATGDFSDLPILADALEDAGCRDEHLLAHCRGPHAHVPGCWALDAVLGR